MKYEFSKLKFNKVTNKKLGIELFLYLFLNLIAHRIEAFDYFDDDSYDYYDIL